MREFGVRSPDRHRFMLGQRHGADRASLPSSTDRGEARNDDASQHPGGGDRFSGQPLGDEVGQVLQRVVEVVLPERREWEVLAHMGRDR